jgi:GAF domain-containing protein
MFRAETFREADRPVSKPFDAAVDPSTHEVATGGAVDMPLAGLAAVTAALVHSLDLYQPTVDETVLAIAQAAVGAVPGAQHCGVLLLRDDGSAVRRAATSSLPVAIGTLIDETGEGPCLLSANARTTVRVEDTATETRWPSYIAGARRLGVGSVLCLPLTVNSNHFGSMSLYADRSHVFSEEAGVLGAMFAAHAAAAMSRANQERQLREALDTRDVIGQAKGILMERHHLNADEAFGVLVTLSQQTNTKLRVVAENLVTPTP